MGKSVKGFLPPHLDGPEVRRGLPAAPRSSPRGMDCLPERGNERLGLWDRLPQQVPKAKTEIGPGHLWEGWAGGLGSGPPPSPPPPGCPVEASFSKVLFTSSW